MTAFGVFAANAALLRPQLTSPLRLQTRRPLRVYLSARAISSDLSSDQSQLRAPTDLVRFRRSRFAAHLTELHLRGLSLPPGAERDPPSRMSAALASAGDAHETRVLARLAELVGAEPFKIPRNHPERYQLTADALRDGVPIVHQPALSDGVLLNGYADVLLRNSHNPFLDTSGLVVPPGDGYSVIEVKLASTVKADYALQAAAYTDLLRPMLASLGLPPPGPAYLWLGAPSVDPQPLDPVEVDYFYQSVRKAFDLFVRDFDPNAPLPPIDAPLSALSPWSGFAKLHITRTDSLLQVAGMRRAQASSLKLAGISTMQELSSMSVEQAIVAVDSIGCAPLEILHKQAELQVASRELSSTSGSDVPAFEIINVPVAAPFGLHRLPPHSAGDVYFDMEGFPLVQGGLEYLFGASEGTFNGNIFHAWWGHDRAQEEATFAKVIAWTWNRWHKEQQSMGIDRNCGDGMHVFHYGHYEVTAMRRLASRAVTCDGLEAGFRLEEMLDAGLFVDIYRIVKASLRVGEPSYSIKNAEKLVGVSRAGNQLADAESSVAMYYEWRRSHFGDKDDNDLLQSPILPTSDGSDVHEIPILKDIEDYNRQDCESLERLVLWLRTLSVKHGIVYLPRLLPNRGGVSGVESDHGSSTGSDNGNGGDEPLAKGACGSGPLRKKMDSDVIRRGELATMRLLSENSDSTAPHALRQAFTNLIGFHVRESGPARARFGDRVQRAVAGDRASLFNDDQCISMVKFDSVMDSSDSEIKQSDVVDSSNGKMRKSRRRRPSVLYSFDPRESSRMRPDSSCAFVRPAVAYDYDAGEEEAVAGFMRIRQVHDDGTIELDVGSKFSLNEDDGEESDPIPAVGCLISCDDLIVCPSAMRASILDSALRVERNDEEHSSLVNNFLLRRGYTRDVPSSARVTRDNVSDVIARLSGDCFVIQGPPGTGKSTLSADVIVNLILKHEKTVAISSNSHAAIDNLLELAVRRGVPAWAVRKIGPKGNERLEELNIGRASSFTGLDIAPYSPLNESLKTVEIDADAAINDGRRSAGNRTRKTTPKPACLVGATAYALSCTEVRGRFDTLFCEEASQVSVANLAAMAPCAESAVLVGDQQQLEMPLQGVHPERVRVSALSYFVGSNVAVVPPSLGLFLETSYRMPPSLCMFLSRYIYDSALVPAASTSSHSVDVMSTITSTPNKCLPSAGDKLKDSGIVFIGREQFVSSARDIGRQQQSKRCCPTEVMIAIQVMEKLVGRGYSAKGKIGILGVEDILVVAPVRLSLL
jgi:predicted RecB family nuclease